MKKKKIVEEDKKKITLVMKKHFSFNFEIFYLVLNLRWSRSSTRRRSRRWELLGTRLRTKSSNRWIVSLLFTSGQQRLWIDFLEAVAGKNCKAWAASGSGCPGWAWGQGKMVSHFKDMVKLGWLKRTDLLPVLKTPSMKWAILQDWVNPYCRLLLAGSGKIPWVSSLEGSGPW